MKSLDAPYEAGRRGAGWLKVKPVHTLDLVVLAAEWGHGRRQGWLSNLHLGARDPETDGFVMLGKTFKGLTDELLAWQTARLLELEAAAHRLDRLRRTRARRRDRVRRHPDELALPRRRRAALRARHPLPPRQARRARPTRSRPCGCCTRRAAADAAIDPARVYPAATASTPSIVSTAPRSCTRVTRSPRWMRASATVTTGKSELSTAVIESSCSVVETE